MNPTDEALVTRGEAAARPPAPAIAVTVVAV